MLQENANLRKRIEAQDGELKKLRGELGALTEAHDRLSDASRRERSGAQAHASKMQSRLIGAVRRLEYLTEADAAKAKKLEEKEKYIHKLETELVRHHKVVGALCNRVCALELARRAPHEVEDLDNETWMMGLPAGVSRQIATVLAAPRAESRPRRGSPQRSRKAPASVPASEEDASIRARAATERMQSHIMQLLHPALSVPTTPRSVESRDVDAAEERRGMRSDVEISFATEEGVPEPRAGAASESLDVSPVWRSAKNPG